MAAYASLVSLMHIIDQIQLHPRPPISIDKQQVQSLTEKITFLQEFLEGYSHVAGYSKEADGLEGQIADAAYAAEDIIESHIVDQIVARSKSHGENINSIDFHKGLQKVIEDIDSCKKEVMAIKNKRGVRDQLQRSSMPAGSLRSSPRTGHNTMVGFDDILHEVIDKLTRQHFNFQTIPIVGMAGMGKTTLARNIYINPLIEQHFDICAWTTISQEYDTQQILREVLHHVNQGREDLSNLTEDKLGEKLHKYLSSRRYLIVMDDLWSIDVWDTIKIFFPDNSNGSGIVITTRLSNLASQLTSSNALEMRFLDEVNSWNLFSKIVFGEEYFCPLELEDIGKKIVEKCKGLPLSIVVIGGLLAKSKQTREYWEYVSENLNSVVNSEDDERCLKILSVSYNQLPIYLKPCILYMGVFSEDRAIRVSMLVKLWVAEGFLKPISGKSLEEIAEECLKDLIDRNLVLVHKLGSTGNIKFCKIHDLLRDFCLREAEDQKFYNVTMRHGFNVPQHENTQRRIVIPQSTSKVEFLDALQSVSLTRSLICDFKELLPSLNFRLLRILKTIDQDSYSAVEYSLDYIFQLVNSRYLAVRRDIIIKFSSSVYLLWNLQTLIVGGQGLDLIAPSQIWNMSQLRHVEFNELYLPDPPSDDIGGQDDIILKNLQTLVKIVNFKCGEEVIKRIPNIKKLRISFEGDEGGTSYCLNNIERLHKLESFRCFSFPVNDTSGTLYLQKLNFPHSLKKLILGGSRIDWQDMLEKIGSLPLLEKLKLYAGSFKGRKWETVEGQFPSLKVLSIDRCSGLEYWMTESSHFPRLERLVLSCLYKLEEIPSEIGEIPTLQSIDLQSCSDSAVISAKKILQEQELLGNECLQVRVELVLHNEALESLARTNFQIRCFPLVPR